MDRHDTAEMQKRLNLGDKVRIYVSYQGINETEIREGFILNKKLEKKGHYCDALQLRVMRVGRVRGGIDEIRQTNYIGSYIWPNIDRVLIKKRAQHEFL